MSDTYNHRFLIKNAPIDTALFSLFDSISALLWKNSSNLELLSDEEKLEFSDALKGFPNMEFGGERKDLFFYTLNFTEWFILESQMESLITELFDMFINNDVTLSKAAIEIGQDSILIYLKVRDFEGPVRPGVTFDKVYFSGTDLGSYTFEVNFNIF